MWDGDGRFQRFKRFQKFRRFKWLSKFKEVLMTSPSPCERDGVRLYEVQKVPEVQEVPKVQEVQINI